MTRKKKIISYVLTIVVLVGGFLALRIPSWTRTYGLSEEVIAGERMPTAEETIRLYFYYRNRRDTQAARQLLTIHMAAQPEANLWSDSIEDWEGWLFVDHKIIEISPGRRMSRKKPRPLRAFMLKTVRIICGLLWQQTAGILAMS